MENVAQISNGGPIRHNGSVAVNHPIIILEPTEASHFVLRKLCEMWSSKLVIKEPG